MLHPSFGASLADPDVCGGADEAGAGVPVGGVPTAASLDGGDDAVNGTIGLEDTGMTCPGKAAWLCSTGMAVKVGPTSGSISIKDASGVASIDS